MNIAKKVSGLLLIALVWSVCPKSSAQQADLYGVAPYPLEITCLKTTSIIFPFAIVSVDKGSRSVLAQKAKGLDNILLLKAAAPDFEQSNLTVVTRDGKLYSFLVDYTKDPLQLTIGFSPSANIAGSGARISDGFNQSDIRANAEKVSALDKSLRGISGKAGGVKLTLLGIYIKDDLLYYQLECSNKSPISYDIERIRFFSSDCRSPKRGAVQQLELHPAQTFNDTGSVGAGASVIKVFALPKMTLEPGKRLQIQISERGGGRHSSIALRGKTLLKARQI